MRPADLKKIRESHEKAMEAYKGKGKEPASWECPGCLKSQECFKPTKGLVGSKGFWDGAKICTNCGHVSFVLVYTTGETIAYPIGE